MPQVYGIGGYVSVPPPPLQGFGPPAVTFKGQLGQQFFDKSTAPPTEYIYNGVTWEPGGNRYATSSAPGIVELSLDITADAPSDTLVPTVSATKTYVDAIVVAGAPVATETTAGIGELATNAEAVAGTASTGLLALFVTPSNLASVFAANPAVGGTTAAAGTFTALTADGTGAVSLGSSTAGNFTVATGDLSLISTLGSLVLTAGESATDAVKIESSIGGIQILASGAAAGEDIVLTSTGSSIRLTATESATDSINIESTTGGVKILASGAAAGEDIVLTATGSSIRLSSTESATDSINIESTAGGINILASGAAAGEDINLTATGSSVNISSTENAALAIYLHADGGASETIRLRADQGTNAASIDLASDVGGVTITGGLGTADAINIVASDTAGGIDIDAGTGGIAVDTTGATVITSTANSAASIFLHANGGTSETIRLHADQGTAVTSLDLLSDVGGITLRAGLGNGDAINISATNAAGGIDIDAGTTGVIVDTTGAISLDSAAASNLTVTGAFALDVGSTLGKVTLSSGQSAADSVVITSLIGGIDILAAGAAAGEDIDIVATGSSVNIQATESDVNAITINASGVDGGINVDAGTSGVIVDTTGAISLDSAAASNLTVTGAFALDVGSTLGKVTLSSGQSANDSLVITSLIGGIDILAAGAAAGEDIDIIATGSSVNIRSTESAVDAVVVESTAGGVQILASGAAAGEDILITATGSSITITATESVTDAINITASGAASRLNLTAGTGSIKFASGLIVKATALSNASTPYTVLGTDYFLACDTSAGILTVTLPAASAVTGRTFVIRDVGGAAGVNNITIGGGGTNLVGGGAAAATKVLSANYSGATVYSDGTVWAYSYVA